MRRVLIAAMTVNGMIAHNESELSTQWTSREDTAFFKKMTKEIGTLIMGRKTFETFNKGLPGRFIYVLTSHPDQIQDMKGVKATGLSPSKLAEKLTERDKSYCVCGGKSVFEQFVDQGLIDELFLTIEPFLFTNGVPFIEKLSTDSKLSLDWSKQLNEHTILFKYHL